MDTFTQTPITILSSLIAVLAIFAWLYGFYKVYMSYRQTEKKQSLYFSLALLFGGLAIIFLAMELTTLQIFLDNTLTKRGGDYVGTTVPILNMNSADLGAYFSYIAVIMSAVAILMFDSFSMSFFENKMKYLIIPILLVLAYVGLYFYPNIPGIQLNKSGTDFNPYHTPETDALLVALFILPVFFPAIIFFISAIQTRGNKYNFRRSFVLALLSIMLGIGYTIEIVGGEAYLSVIGRIFILLYPYLTWSVLQSSKYVRKILGAPS